MTENPAPEIKKYVIPLDCPFCNALNMHHRTQYERFGYGMLNVYQCEVCHFTHKRSRTFKEHNDETLLYFKYDTSSQKKSPPQSPPPHM